MSNYIAVDCGKFETKVCSYLEKTQEVKRFKLRTKTGPGVFEDDMLKRGTVIAQVDKGDCVSFGYGAVTEPNMETSKKSDVHRLGTMISIAFALGTGDFKDVYVAIGMPLDIAGNAMERNSYKTYILGDLGEKHTVKWKSESEGPIHTTTFTIKKAYVYPEGCGVLWLYPDRLRSSTAIIDIGNLNTNNIYAEGLNPEDKMCFTGELGGKVLISGLARALEAELGARVIDSMVATALAKETPDRHLVSARGDRSMEEKSAAIIADYALDHVRLIKQSCDVHHWPLSFADIVCVGGTVRLLRNELKEVFGETVFIPEEQEYANVSGFLRRMCASLNVDISGETR